MSDAFRSSEQPAGWNARNTIDVELFHNDCAHCFYIGVVAIRTAAHTISLWPLPHTHDNIQSSCCCLLCANDPYAYGLCARRKRWSKQKSNFVSTHRSPFNPSFGRLLLFVFTAWLYLSAQILKPLKYRSEQQRFSMQRCVYKYTKRCTLYSLLNSQITQFSLHFMRNTQKWNKWINITWCLKSVWVFGVVLCV